MAHAPHVPPKPPRVASNPKLAPIPTKPFVHGQQQGSGVVLQAGEDKRGGKMGNDHHYDANKVVMCLTGKPKIVVIPIMINQQLQPQPQHQQQQHLQQQHQQHQQQQVFCKL